MKGEDYMWNLELLGIDWRWIDSDECILYGERVEELLLGVRGMKGIVGGVGIELLYLFWSMG